jgi:hypothetical protein
MHITFPDDQPVFDGANLTVRSTARVDGEPVECAITAEALEDHFGAHSALESALMAAFDNGRSYPFGLRGSDRPERRQRRSVT